MAKVGDDAEAAASAVLNTAGHLRIVGRV